MKRAYLFSIFPLFLIFFTCSLTASEEKSYLETVSKLFKSPVVETHNHYEISKKTEVEYVLKMKDLLLECQKFNEWSLKNCTISLFQEKEISEEQRRKFEKVLKCSVRLYGRVSDALEKYDCFIPVSRETYNRFPTARWNMQKVKSGSATFPEIPVDNAMKFYNIKEKYYMVLYQKNIDMCDIFLEAVYGQKSDDLGEEESTYVKKSLISIQKGVEDIMELLGSDKKQVIRKDNNFDSDIIQELLK